MAQPAKISREQIVSEAIAILQHGGLSALTLRQLAKRLGVRAPSLARHVGDKARLTALVAARIFLEALDTIPPGLAGDEWLSAFGHALRDKQAQTRDISALVASIPPDEEIDAGITARLEAEMQRAGLQGPQAQTEQAAIQAFVTGWMVFETSPRRELFARRLADEQAFDHALAALIAGFAAARP